ncbi:MAG: fumarylacetoacetase, partial [Pyrinomonadaceae bacterium]
MTYEINETHDPNLKSWVESANLPDTDFPIQNLPFTVADISDSTFDGGWNHYNIGVVIGDSFLNLDACADDGLFHEIAEAEDWFNESAIYSLAGIPQSARSQLRRRIAYL